MVADSWIGPRVRFSCAQCGECCRLYWVPVTHRDIERISHRTGLRPADFTAPIPKSVVGEWGLPSFLLDDGEHYLILRKRLDGFCVFISPEEGKFRCAIYDARPLTCRFYPFVYISGEPIRFELAEDAPALCPGIGRGPAVSFGSVARFAVQREKELEEYKALVNRWNRLVLSGAVRPSFEVYLDFLLSPPP